MTAPKAAATKKKELAKKFREKKLANIFRNVESYLFQK
jgi:hypothetical protein